MRPVSPSVLIQTQNPAYLETEDQVVGEAACAKGFRSFFVTSRMYSALALEVGHWAKTVLSGLHRASVGPTSPAHTP